MHDLRMEAFPGISLGGIVKPRMRQFKEDAGAKGHGVEEAVSGDIGFVIIFPQGLSRGIEAHVAL